MKSLMLKDFYVLRKQLWLYAAVIVVFQTFMDSMGLFITFLYAAMLPATAFAYDDQSKWDMMELMLPYDTRQIVLSRYCVGWIAAPCLTAFGLLARRLIAWAPGLHVGETDFRLTLAGLFAALGFMALTMPVYFRYDAEKSRLVRMLVLFLVCALTGGFVASAGAASAALPDKASWGFVWGAFAAAAVLTAASIPLSMLAWKRRHR